nr:hypothetical protein [Tanacetum cinerariifolium]
SSSKRKVKLPEKFQDHVMTNLSQNDELSRQNVVDIELEVDEVENRGLLDDGYMGNLWDDMSENALRYHLRRMWSKNGFVDVQVDANGGCYFKFKSEEGVEKVIEQGPWTVNHKPLFVQKWVPNIGLTRKEETKIPLWAKLKNIPLEAWTKDGISVMASSLGKPLRMDNITTQACVAGRGRAEFDRVDVEYQWKPDICSHCMVFGHNEKSVEKKIKFDCNFIYASNCGNERRKLWNEVSEMQELIDCANEVEMEDINTTGLFFTWIKSPSKLETSIMKKLDRILINGSFIDSYKEAYGQFMSFLISDHSAAVLTILKSLMKKRRSFRFSNYIVDKKYFFPTVEKEWKKNMDGYTMYRVVQKLKAIKKPIKRLNWKNGDLTERVELCRDKLMNIVTLPNHIHKHTKLLEN